MKIAHGMCVAIWSVLEGFMMKKHWIIDVSVWRPWLKALVCVLALAAGVGAGFGGTAGAAEFQWAGMMGTMDFGVGPVYGTQGVADPANRPGGRYLAMSWIDGSGALWLFGGYGYDSAGFSGRLNDLWKYDPASGHWTWMKGASTINQPGTYGVLGNPAEANTPGSREGAVSWIDGFGALCLFGGYGYDGAGNLGRLNDLWKYDPATGNWAWMKGSSTQNQQGTYGVLGNPAAANTPGAREGAASWIDGSGALWLSGGYGYDGTGNLGRLNDLWKYDPTAGNWTWMKGASTQNQPGTYGVLGTPAPANTPGARKGAVSWTDGSGVLWLFGGYGYDGTGMQGDLNDLWNYDPSTGNWAWMKGASTTSQPGTYGVLGTPAPANTPGSREDAVSWIDGSGALWLSGGSGYDGAGSLGRLNDLWKYDPASGNWTWMKGASTINQQGTYGTQGTPAAANTPGARFGAVSWTDGSGALWLFSGYSYDGVGSWGRLNDLWKYDPTTGNWTWMEGASAQVQLGTYGVQGTPAPGNIPGERQFAVSWIDGSGGLWLFGGSGYGSVWSAISSLNDLWKYDPATGNWAWMKGASTINQAGTYGVPGTPAPANTPGARFGAVSWTDVSGVLWLFGGNGYDGAGGSGYLNDLWKYDPTTGNYTWMKGASTINQTGTYGVQGTPAPANTPGSRQGGVSWIDGSGAMWLFGGYGYDGAGSSGYLNDLWKYDPTTGNWTWMKGGSTRNQPGTYGVLGTPAPANTPGTRNQAVSWIDGSGSLWLFGGYGYDGSGSSGNLNDLWKYDPVSGDWTWMKGASTTNQPGTYGTLGTPAPGNTPGARYGAVSWTDGSGVLWLHGGSGYDGAGIYGNLNDLCKYDPSTGNWTWMKGASTRNQPGTSGTLGSLAPANTPGARQSAVSWIDGSGSLWLFGGSGRDCGNYPTLLGDLWQGEMIYTLTFQTDGTAGATLTGSTIQQVIQGDNATPVTANAPASHNFTKWTLAGVDYSTDNPLTVTNVAADMTLTAVYTIKTYTLTYTAGTHGSISGTSPQTVNHGANGTTVTAIADAGFHFTEWNDGFTENPRTDTNVTADISVTARFAAGSETNRNLTFDGVDEYVTVPHAASLDVSGTDQVTVEAWVRKNAAQSGTITVVRKDSAYSLHLRNGNEPAFSIVDGGGITWEAASGTALANGKWYHLAGTFNNNDVKIHINGYESTGTGSPGAVGVGAAGSPVGFGANAAAPGQYLDGEIDEVRIWSTARSTDNIRQSMCSTLSTPQANLVGYWTLYESSGAACSDISGNGNGGTLINMETEDHTASEAPIGDFSACDYTEGDGFSLSLSHADGDSLVITSDGGDWSEALKSGIHVYRVNSPPNVVYPPFGWKSFAYTPRYWGVFITGGTTPSYGMEYHYAGYPGIVKEDSLRMAFRKNPGDGHWKDLKATIDTGANILSRPGQTGTEFILGELVDPRNAIQYGGADYVSVPANATLDLDDTGTLEAWIYPEAFTADAGIMLKGTTDGINNTCYGFGLGGGGTVFTGGANTNIGFAVGNTGGGVYLLTGATNLSVDTWYHVACVWDNVAALGAIDTMTIYINGVQEATISGVDMLNNAATVTADDLRFGMQAISNPDVYFHGWIDEIRVWNTVRTQTDVQDNMCQKLAGSEAGLAGYWRFDEETDSTTTPDYSNPAPSPIDGTMTGFVNVSTSRVCSSAPIGDASAHDYNAGTSDINITHLDGDAFRALANGGVWAASSGIHVYRVDEAPVYPPDLWNTPPYVYQSPNGLTPPDPDTVPGSGDEWSSVDYYRYWGVFVTDWTGGPVYNTVYTYTGNPSVPVDESVLGLAQRDQYADRWDISGALLAAGSDTLTDTGETKQHPEYVLAGDDEPLSNKGILFSAHADMNTGCIEISWETTTEMDVIGFQLWRSTEKLTDSVKVKDGYLESQDNTGIVGATYTYTDCGLTLADGTAYYYMIESIGINKDGKFYGPYGPVSKTDSVSEEGTPSGSDSNCFISVMTE